MQCLKKLRKEDYKIKLTGVSNVGEAFSAIRKKEGKIE